MLGATGFGCLAVAAGDGCILGMVGCGMGGATTVAGFGGGAAGAGGGGAGGFLRGTSAGGSGGGAATRIVADDEGGVGIGGMVLPISAIRVAAAAFGGKVADAGGRSGAFNNSCGTS